MTVEIREVVLKARVDDTSSADRKRDAELRQLKNEMLVECKRLIADALKKRNAR